MPFSPSTHPVVAIDVFAVAHRLHGLLTTESSDLEKVSFPNANRRKGSTVYARLAYRLIDELRAWVHPNGITLLLFDNAVSKSEGRRDISPTYKKHRQEKPKTFYRTIDFVQFVCMQTFPSTAITIRVPQREADDLVKTVVQRAILEEQPDMLSLLRQRTAPSRLLMVANDSDWYACLNDRVDMWWYPKKGDSELYTYQNFFNEFDFYPSLTRVAVYKALMGDSADNVEPILRKRDIEHDVLLHLINEYGSTAARAESLPVYAGLDEVVPESVRHILHDKQTQYKINLRLTDALPTSTSRMTRYAIYGKEDSQLGRTLEQVLLSVLSPAPQKQRFSFGGVAANV